MYANFDQRSLRAKLNVAEQTDFDYWTVTASTDKGGYTAKGAGFTVAGDDRLPINLTISADGNQQYTIRWDAGQSVDHFCVSINYGEQVFDNITSHEQQVTLADDGYYTIYVYSRDAANNDLGSIYQSVNTYTQEARDLKLHFYIPEARGFIFGAALAHALHAGLVLARKPGKLPYKTISYAYGLEYGTDELQIHEDSIKPGQRVAIVDDLLATGGTALACAKLVEKAGGVVVGFTFAIELCDLPGRETLAGYPVHTILQY